MDSDFAFDTSSHSSARCKNTLWEIQKDREVRYLHMAQKWTYKSMTKSQRYVAKRLLNLQIVLNKNQHERVLRAEREKNEALEEGRPLVLPRGRPRPDAKVMNKIRGQSRPLYTTKYPDDGDWLTYRPLPDKPVSMRTIISREGISKPKRQIKSAPAVQQQTQIVVIVGSGSASDIDEEDEDGDTQHNVNHETRNIIPRTIGGSLPKKDVPVRPKTANVIPFSHKNKVDVPWDINTSKSIKPLKPKKATMKHKDECPPSPRCNDAIITIVFDESKIQKRRSPEPSFLRAIVDSPAEREVQLEPLDLKVSEPDRNTNLCHSEIIIYQESESENKTIKSNHDSLPPVVPKLNLEASESGTTSSISPRMGKGDDNSSSLGSRRRAKGRHVSLKADDTHPHVSKRTNDLGSEATSPTSGHPPAVSPRSMTTDKGTPTSDQHRGSMSASTLTRRGSFGNSRRSSMVTASMSLDMRRRFTLTQQEDKRKVLSKPKATAAMSLTELDSLIYKLPVEQNPFQDPEQVHEIARSEDLIMADKPEEMYVWLGMNSQQELKRVRGIKESDDDQFKTFLIRDGGGKVFHIPNRENSVAQESDQRNTPLRRQNSRF